MTPEFWRLIDHTRPAVPDPVAHATALTERLVEAGVDETIRFAEAFDRAMDALYTWELWGAAFLALGGCGDDAFEYLRAWMIGSGDVTWSLASSDPESVFIHALGGSADPEAKWETIRLHEGEALLYAAGAAHERLTGEWRAPRYASHPREPEGEEWTEALLPHLYPNLVAALPPGWWDGPSVDAVQLAVLVDVERGIASFLEGDHTGAAELLEPLIGDPESWRLLPEGRVGDVAYAVGIGRLLRGDVGSAVDALRMAGAAIDTEPHLRRALAQAEMASGDLEAADSHIDQSEDAEPLDRVLAAKLAWRKGEPHAALRRATSELESPTSEDDHPWDIAGRLNQIGQIFVEAGEGDAARRAVERLEPHVADAPGHLPLSSHVDLLKASVLRMYRPAQALAILETMWRRLEGTDRAECLRELARCQRALGDDEAAVSSYRASAQGFDRAGERWESSHTAAEGGL